MADNKDLLAPAIEQIKSGKAANLSDVLTLVAPSAAPATQPKAIPTGKAITPAQRASIEHLPEVFGKVTPTEVRTLAPVEVESLVDEKSTLDSVKKMAEARLKDITQIVHNHLDTLVENLTASKDKDGHFILAGTATTENTERQFSRETRSSSASLDVEALKALDTGEPDAIITHEQFLSMTTQVRVVDEDKVMLALKKNPALVNAIAAATRPGSTSTSMFLRDKK